MSVYVCAYVLALKSNDWAIEMCKNTRKERMYFYIYELPIYFVPVVFRKEKCLNIELIPPAWMYPNMADGRSFDVSAIGHVCGFSSISFFSDSPNLGYFTLSMSSMKFNTSIWGFWVRCPRGKWSSTLSLIFLQQRMKMIRKSVQWIWKL